MKNITFLLGAGASYYACPVWKEQAEKMVQLAKKYLREKSPNFSEEMPADLEEYEKIIWDIGYFGTKALKFGTIDTYAKKLYLNHSYSELSRLKLSVSVFFTIWQLTDDYDLKNRMNKEFEEIDRRYISLFASILESEGGAKLKIKDNIKFVTWNYDLQLELAYKSFCHDGASWNYMFDNLYFRVNHLNHKPLQICHLNGYHGFYKSNDKETCFIDIPNSKNIVEMLKELGFLPESLSRRQLNLSDHINYAWESNSFSNKTREEAKKIFVETDILIIIGYSFPNFNKEIDKMLFDNLRKKSVKIYYQDPNANQTIIEELVGIENPIICQKEKLDTFILPYEF